MAQSLRWSQFRAVLVSPALLVTCAGLSAKGLTYFLPGLLGFNPIALLISLSCCSVIFALGAVWLDLLTNQQRRFSARMRVALGLILFLGLAVEFGQYLFVGFDQIGIFFIAKLFWRAFSDSNPLSQIRLELLCREAAWVTAIVSVWVFSELLLPVRNGQPDKPGPARGYVVLALLVQLVGVAAVHEVLDRSVVARFMASSASLQWRALGAGSIGEAVCNRDFATARQRIDARGHALRDDELLRIVESCVIRAGPFVVRHEDDGLRRQAISMIAPLVVAHGLAVEAGGYCGQGAAGLLQDIYRNAFSAENLVSAKDGGLQIDCLKRLTEWGRPDIAEPIWWLAVESEGQPGLGNANDGKERLHVLKQLGVDLRQNNSQGRNLLSRVNVPATSNAWLEALVDEGLDPHQPGWAGQMPLSVRLLCRRYLDRSDAEVAAQLSAKVGDPSTPELLQELRSGRMARAVGESAASDEQRAGLWAWVADRIDPYTLMAALRARHVEEGAGPKLKALIDGLASKEGPVPTS